MMTYETFVSEWTDAMLSCWNDGEGRGQGALITYDPEKDHIQYEDDSYATGITICDEMHEPDGDTEWSDYTEEEVRAYATDLAPEAWQEMQDAIRDEEEAA